jgi:tetratricopeptide (TPR) repeat protein
VLGFAIVNMAEAVALDGEPEIARSHYDEGIAAFRDAGDRWGEAFAVDSLGVMLARQGRTEEATQLHDQALGMSRAIRDERGVARALAHLGDAARAADVERARSLYIESFEIRRALGDLPGIASGMEKLASVVTDRDARAAAVLLGAAERVRELIRAPVPRAARDEYEALRAGVESALGQPQFDEARSEGRRLSPDAVLARILP